MIRLDKSLGSLSSHHQANKKMLSNLPISSPIKEELEDSPSK